MNSNTTNLQDNLKIAASEKDIENAYRTAFQLDFPASISSANQTDGFLLNKEGNLLMEYKYQKDFTSSKNRAEVILQAIYYLKRKLTEEGILAKTIFGGETKTCFCLSVKFIEVYLDREDINWSFNPSEAAEKQPEIIKEMTEDKDLCPLTIYNVLDETFNFQSIIDEIRSINKNEEIIAPATMKNFINKYKYWDENVLACSREDKKSGKVKTEDGKTVNSSEIYLSFLFNADKSIYDSEKCVAIIGYKYPVRVNEKPFKKLQQDFSKTKASELSKIAANKDQILEEIYRRYTGAFFTPPIWAAEAQKMISEQFGEDWKDKYIVWDCACGTANLTRDRDKPFSELYLSTLEQEDIDIINSRGYNPEAIKFQYNFLSEVSIPNSFSSGLDNQNIPASLKKAFETGDKPILFFINPPFGSATTFGRGNTGKKGIAKNEVNTEMLKKDLGKGSSDLSTQFLYRIIALKEQYPQAEISVAFFNDSKTFTQPSYSKFLNSWENIFSFINGMLLSSKHFSGISENWGISFTLWTDREIETKCKVLVLKDMNTETQNLEVLGTKELYPTKQNLNHWAQKEIKIAKKEDSLPLRGAININYSKKSQKLENSFGHLVSGFNRISDNGKCYFILSSSYANQGFSVVPENFRKVTVLFSVRNLIKCTWINSQDEYQIPDTNHPDYEQWNNDAIVYFLFNESSKQSSLRNVEYNNKNWNIENEFFFLSNAEMKELADNTGFNKLYQDAENFPKDRYVYKQLENLNLSEDAKAILELARNLIRKSISIRKQFSADHPELHLQAWDAGWYQVKQILKEHFKGEFKEFKELFKKFSARMTEGVYKFGFLKVEDEF